MAGTVAVSGGQVEVVAQSKSLGQSTLNEKRTRKSWGSKPVAAASPLLVTSKRSYGEKSPSLPVRTTSTWSRSAGGISAVSRPSSAVRSAGGTTAAAGAPLIRSAADTAQSTEMSVT